MCQKFSDIRTPLNLWWAEREKPDTYMPRLEAFEKSLGGFTSPHAGGWNARGHFPGNREHVIVLAAEVWKSASDDELVGYSEEFKQTLKALKKFVEISNAHTPYLLRKAQRIEEYLNQR